MSTAPPVRDSPDPPDPGVSERRRRLAEILSESGAAALLVVARSANDPDLAPFVGSIHLGQAVLLAAAGATPKLAFFTPMEREEAARSGLDTLSPEQLELDRLSRERPLPSSFLAAVLRGVLAAGEVPPGRIALAGHAPAGTLHAAVRELEGEGYAALDGNEIVRRITQRKTGWELDGIRRAAEGTGDAFRRVARLLAAAGSRDGVLWLESEPLRIARLRAEIALALAPFGLSQPEGNIVAAGEQGAVPHNQGDSERVLRAGQSLIVDLYPRGELFADCTRTFCVGRPSEALAAGHAAVREALERAEAGARPGVRGFSLQESTCAFLAERGYETPITHPGTTRGYVHGLGHGVGYELHELPSFRKQSGAEGVLGEGNVVTIEPGLYDPQAGWAVRLEDLYVIEAGGPRSLTPLPRDLDPRAW